MLWRIIFILLICTLFKQGLSQLEPNCDGKQVIVQLFEWKWTDIANECETFLGPADYCGVLVSPPNEHVIVENQQPWGQRYQPVSYNLHSRSGTLDQFADMIDRCNSVGVRIYVDAVMNHMSSKDRKGVGSAGSSYDGSSLSFPEVPYGPEHFTPKSSCPTSSGNVEEGTRTEEVRNCYLMGYADLHGSNQAVQSALTNYLNNLVDLGVAGIRIDAAKNMWPEDLKSILSKVKQLPTSKGFKAGSTLFVYSDVIRLGTADPITPSDYYDIGRVTDFTYIEKIASAFGANGLAHLGNPEHGVTNESAIVFVDNHYSQRNIDGTVTYKTPVNYKMAVAFTLGFPFGFTQVMSSYEFSNSDQGPPSNPDGSTLDVTVKSDGSCSNGWVCEHRWNAIAKMVEFRNKMKGLGVSSDEYTPDYVAFSRGPAGTADGYFIMAKTVPFTISNRATGLPPGKHCNIIDNGKTCIDVREGGQADITLSDPETPIFAWCKGCNEGPIPTLPPVIRTTTPVTTYVTSSQTTSNTTSFNTPPTAPCIGDNCPTAATSYNTETTSFTSSTPSTSFTGTTVRSSTTRAASTSFVPPTAPCIGEFCPTERPVDMRRTVVFLKKQLTGSTDFMFIRGGLDETHYTSCQGITNATISPCSITINITRLGTSSHYQMANAFSSRDTLLDWYGMQDGQGTYFSRKPLGTPVVRTTNDPSSDAYQPLNTFGDNYHMVDFLMDFYMTEDEWFDFRGIIDIDQSNDDIEEGEISQTACTGSGGGVTPPGTPTKNHRGRVGYINVFEWGSGSCQIYSFSDIRLLRDSPRKI